MHRSADKPKENKTATPDPMKTLFVGRLSYDTTEDKLKAEMEEFGPVAQVIYRTLCSGVGVSVSGCVHGL